MCCQIPTKMLLTARTGLLRLAPFICHEASANNHLTAAETTIYCSIMYRRTLTSDMLAEVEATQANARQVAAAGTPAAPLYVFISNGDGLPMDNWAEVLAAYVAAANTSGSTWAITPTLKPPIRLPMASGPFCNKSRGEAR